MKTIKDKHLLLSTEAKEKKGWPHCRAEIAKQETNSRVRTGNWNRQIGTQPEPRTVNPSESNNKFESPSSSIDFHFLNTKSKIEERGSNVFLFVCIFLIFSFWNFDQNLTKPQNHFFVYVFEFENKLKIKDERIKIWLNGGRRWWCDKRVWRRRKCGDSEEEDGWGSTAL